MTKSIRLGAIPFRLCGKLIVAVDFQFIIKKVNQL